MPKQPKHQAWNTYTGHIHSRATAPSLRAEVDFAAPFLDMHLLVDSGLPSLQVGVAPGWLANWNRRLWRQRARAPETMARRPVGWSPPLGAPSRPEPPGGPRGGAGNQVERCRGWRLTALSRPSISTSWPSPPTRAGPTMRLCSGVSRTSSGGSSVTPSLSRMSSTWMQGGAAWVHGVAAWVHGVTWGCSLDAWACSLGARGCSLGARFAAWTRGAAARFGHRCGGCEAP